MTTEPEACPADTATLSGSRSVAGARPVWETPELIDVSVATSTQTYIQDHPPHDSTTTFLGQHS